MSALVVHVVGARPNYMKIAPLYAALERRGVDQRLVHTGQHYDAPVSDVFFAELPLPEPHVKLEVRSGTHGAQTARALTASNGSSSSSSPTSSSLPGDVNSTLAAALAAVKLHIPVCHLEAGLRSFDWAMPEEHNRRLTDHVSTLLLTHSAEAHENLAAEGIAAERIAFVGNTMIDTLFQNIDKARSLEVWKEYGVEQGDYVLVTLHRPALVDDAELLTRTWRRSGSSPRPCPSSSPSIHELAGRSRSWAWRSRAGSSSIEPQPYGRFLSLESAAMAVVTDSGGVQEETTALGIRCFTLRNNTERPVTVSHGTNIVLGLDPDRLARSPTSSSFPLREERPPLWDGHAGERAADEIEAALGIVRSGAAAAAVARRPEPL